MALASFSQKYKNFKTLMAENNMTKIAFAFFLISAIAGTFISTGVETFMKSFFPSMDDTTQIIENQNKQFNDVKENLAKLQGALSGKDRETFNSLKDSYQSAFKASEVLATSYQILKDENDSLRKVLKKEKGIDGGFDILLPEKQGYKLDSAVTFGNKYYGNAQGSFTLTSKNPEENLIEKNIKVGQGMLFTNENGKKCSLNFLGAKKIEGGSTAVGKFAVQCN